MSTLSVVKQFYIAENAGSGFRACFVILKSYTLRFQRVEETLDRSIIPAIALPAHAALDA